MIFPSGKGVQTMDINPQKWILIISIACFLALTGAGQADSPLIIMPSNLIFTVPNPTPTPAPMLVVGQPVALAQPIIAANPVTSNPVLVISTIAPVYIPQGQPDLVALEITGPSEATPSQVIEITGRLKNTGSVSSPASSMLFYLRNPVSGTTWILGSSITKSGIEAGSGGPATRSFSIPASIPAGTYDLVFILDPDNMIGESDETNNQVVSTSRLTINAMQVAVPVNAPIIQAIIPSSVSTSLSRAPTPTPALDVSSVVDYARTPLPLIASVTKIPTIMAGIIPRRTITPVPGNGTQTPVLRVVLPTAKKNIKPVITHVPAITLSSKGPFYDNAPGTPTPKKTPTPTKKPIVIITPEDFGDVTPTPTPVGLHTRVDSPDIVLEKDPTLTYPALWNVGDTVTLGWQIKNIGKADANGFSIGIYLEKQPVDSSKPILIKEIKENTVKTGFSGFEKVNVQILSPPGSPSLEPGYYWVYATADINKEVAEWDEENNELLLVTSQSISGTGDNSGDDGPAYLNALPDLVALYPQLYQVTGSSWTKGATVNIPYRVSNQGSVDSGASKLVIDATLKTTGKKTTLTTVDIPSLKPFGTDGYLVQGTAKVPIPASLATGTYIITERADGYLMVTELSETNNDYVYSDNQEIVATPAVIVTVFPPGPGDNLNSACPSPPAGSNQDQQISAAVYSHTNSVRAQYGLKSYCWNQQLADSAQNLAMSKPSGHPANWNQGWPANSKTGQNIAVSTPIGITYTLCNMYTVPAISDNPDAIGAAIVDNFVNRDMGCNSNNGHHNNILSQEFDTIGIGTYREGNKVWVVQNFIKKL
jgi:uncharacterized protein YkwD